MSADRSPCGPRGPRSPSLENQDIYDHNQGSSLVNQSSRASPARVDHGSADPSFDFMQQVRELHQELESNFNQGIGNMRSCVEGAVAEIEQEHDEQNRSLQELVEQIQAKNTRRKEEQVQRIQDMYANFVENQTSFKTEKIEAIQLKLEQIKSDQIYQSPQQ